MSNTTSVPSHGSARSILVIATCFGLVTGLVEGILLLLLHRSGWLFWRIANRSISLETIWISAIVDLLLFSLVGLVLALAAGQLRRPWVMRIGIYLVSLLALFDWLLIILSGRLAIYAIIVLALGLSFELSRWLYRHVESVARFAGRSLPWLAGLTLLTVVFIQGGFWLQEQIAIAQLPATASGSPNVLVVVVDTLRADHLSNYGYTRPTSPHLEEIARQGVLFENAFAAGAWTQPSHASLLTGRYTYEHNAELKPLDGRYPTIAEAFRSEGYRTAAFSANNFFFTRRQGFGRGFIRFEDQPRSLAYLAANTLYGYVVDYYLLRRTLGFGGAIARQSASDINNAALAWIDRHPDKPFFVFLNYFDVHDPYLPPPPFRNQFSSVENPGGLVNSYLDRYHPQLTPEQLQSEIDAYDGAIAYVDDQIARLMAELEKRGLASNTLVVITSDHGESFGEHGLLQHSNALYLEEIHVPLILWWPGHLPAAQRVTNPVTNAALPATLMDLIGTGRAHPFPGPPLSLLWKDAGTHTDWPYPLSELAHFPAWTAQAPSAHGAMKSIVSPEWHYITHETFGEELYARLDDPQEAVNLAQNQKFQPIVSQFRTYLDTLLAQVITWLR